MKKLILFTLAIFSFVAFAQKAIDEKDVPAKFTKDFHANYEHAKNAKWHQVDSSSYEVKFTNNDIKTSIVFRNMFMETRWEVKPVYIPSAIKTYVTENHPKAKIVYAYILDISKNKSYEVGIKEKELEYLLTFEINGTFKEFVKKEIPQPIKKVKKEKASKKAKK